MDCCLKIFRDSPELWRRLALNGMGQDFSWSASARHYDELYVEALGA